MVLAIQSTGLEATGKTAGPVNLLTALLGGSSTFSGMLQTASADALVSETEILTDQVPAVGLLLAGPFVPAITPVPTNVSQELSFAATAEPTGALQPATALVANGGELAATASLKVGDMSAEAVKPSAGLAGIALQALAAAQAQEAPAPEATAPMASVASGIQLIKKQSEAKSSEHTIKSLLLSRLADTETPAASLVPVKGQSGAQPAMAASPSGSALVFANLKHEGGLAGFSLSAEGQGAASQASPATLAALAPATHATQEFKPAAPSSAFSRLLQEANPVMPVTEQVLVHMKSALREGTSHINIQLEPEELGRIEVRLQVGHDGKTGALITAENKDTLSLLQRDMRGLQQALEDAGLKADAGSLSFNLRGDQSHQQAGGFERSVNTSMVIKVDEEGTAVSATAGKPKSVTPGGVDITV